MKGDGTTDTDTLTVGKNSRSTVTVKNKLGVGDDPAHDFSAKVECTNGQKIIAERPMYFNYKPGGLNWNGGHDVVGAQVTAGTFYFAEGTTRPGFDPYLCLQNPGSKDAKVTITYMKGDGSTETQSLTVGRNSRSTVTVKDKLGEGDDPAHDFSATVQCTNGQKIIAERPMYFNYKPGELNWNGGHDVVGAVAPSAIFYFAEGTTRPGFDPYLCIQNPGTKNASVKITYMKGDGSTETQSLTVGRNSRSTVTVKDKLGEGDDPAHDFSATVQCTNGQKIIAERPMYFNYKPGELNWNGGHDVVGAVAPSAIFYFAEGTTRPGFDPYLCIQNPGTKNASVKITYMKGDGSTETQSLTVGRNSRSTVTVKDKLGEGDDPAHDFSATVQCTNGQKIIAERPMYFNYKPGELNWNGGHDVVGAVAPSAIFYFAEGTTRPGFDPYLCIQNPGTKNASVKITYMKGDGSTETQSLTVGRNSRSTVTVKDKLGEGDDPAHDFSATVQCTNGQKIIAERPMYFNYKPGELNWNGCHDVVGAVAPSAIFYFAEGTTRPGFDPYLCIQNPGTKNASVKITYMKGDGSTETQSLTVGRNSRSTVTVKNKLGVGDDPAHDFSATVQCTNGQKIIAERPMYFNYKPGELNWNGGHDVVGAVAPSAIFYFAEGTTRPGFDPYLCIQNPGSKDANVTITYMKGDGTTDTDTLTVGKN